MELESVPKIEGAILYGLTGLPCREGEILFVPALLDFEAISATTQVDFCDDATRKSDNYKRDFEVFAGTLYEMNFASLWL